MSNKSDKSLKSMACKERLKELGLFSLEKGKLIGVNRKHDNCV